MDFDTLINNRHSADDFKQTQKPSYVKIIKSIDAALKAPNAGNLPSLKFILVTDTKKIQELAQAADQSFISKASYIVVICTDPKFLDKYYSDRAERYARQQAGAAIENLLLKVEEQGLGACWIGAYSDETIKRILDIPEEVFVEAMIPIGYEIEKNKREKHKPQIENNLYFETYGNRYYRPLRSPDSQSPGKAK